MLKRDKDTVSRPGMSPRTDPDREIPPLSPPFHNDAVLLSVIDSIVKGEDINLFVETGAHVGSGLLYMAQTYPTLKCYSCEPHLPTYHKAEENLKDVRARVSLFAGTSADFFQRFANVMPYMLEQPALFWLDAHSHGFGLPLPEELEFVTHQWTGGYILIDDFKVPGHPGFGFDTYARGEISWDLIKDSLAMDRVKGLCHPGYEPAPFPEGRGWLLVSFGAVRPWVPSEVLAPKVFSPVDESAVDLVGAEGGTG